MKHVFSRSIPCAFLMVFAVVFFSAKGMAAEVEVTFTSSLTNNTDWVYTQNTKTNVDGRIYISSKTDIAVISPIFDFAITSITVVAKHTNDSEKRKLLYVFPLIDNKPVDGKEYWREITPNGTEENEVSCSWSKEDRIQSIGFKADEGSDGNIYLLSAEICGVSIPYPPENLEATRVGGRQITVKWLNPEVVKGNKISVYKSSWNEEGFETVASYDFNEVSNDGATNEKADDFIDKYPDFSGSTLIYLPAKSAGQIQISKSDEKGVLKHNGFEDCGSLCVDMTLRKYFYVKTTEENGVTTTEVHEDDDAMTIGYEESAGKTNVLATVKLEKDFRREIISLKGFPADTPILFNATGDKTNHRVIIDEMKFIKNYSPAGERHELVQEINTSESKIRLLNLERNTDYVIKVTAIDADGKESENAELRVKTSSQNDSGFFIRIQ